MRDDLKGELAAAVAAGAGVLVALGYVITWTELERSDLPARPILSALPKGYFVSAAVGSLALAFVVVLLLCGIALALRSDRTQAPGAPWWVGFGLVVAVTARAVTAVTNPQLVGEWDGGTTLAGLIVGLGVVVVACVLGAVARWAATKHEAKVGRATIAAMACMAVLSVAAFAVRDATLVADPFPHTTAFLDVDYCPPVFDADVTPSVQRLTPQDLSGPGAKEEVSTVKRCAVTGFYVAENDQWIFIAKPPDAANRAPGRLLLVPREHARLSAVANEPLFDIP